LKWTSSSPSGTAWPSSYGNPHWLKEAGDSTAHAWAYLGAHTAASSRVYAAATTFSPTNTAAAGATMALYWSYPWAPPVFVDGCPS
jgi:hypothetical protein